MNANKLDLEKYAHRLITLLSLGLMLLLPSRPASAQYIPPKWSMSAVACVPGDSTIRRGLFRNATGKVGFSNSATGTIFFYCPVSDTTLHNSSITSIAMTVGGPAGGTPGKITYSAALKAVEADGEVKQILEVSEDDDCLGSSVSRYVTCIATSTPKILEFTNYYYVEIRLYREATGINNEIRVLGVSFQ